MSFVRIQLELPEEQLAEVEKLMDALNLRTKKDLFNNALTLLEWAVNERKAGRAIASVDDAKGRLREIVMPALAAVKPENPSRRESQVVGNV